MTSPTELRVRLSLELQRRWKVHVEQLKTTKSHWWRIISQPSETEILLWTALAAWGDEDQELQVAALPQWFLSFSCTKQCISAVDLATLNFIGVEWYEHPQELSHAFFQLRLTNLHTLLLDNQEVVHDEHLALVVTLAPQLETLNVSYCSQLTDAGVQLALQSYCATLKTLSCNGLRRLTHNGIQALEACEKLRNVQLEGCLGIDQLPALLAHPSLARVNLQGLSNVSDCDLKAFLARKFVVFFLRLTSTFGMNSHSCICVCLALWSRVRCLKLGETEISTASILELTSQLVSPYALLHELDLSWCSGCEAPGLGSIFEKMPLLTTLKLRCLNIQDGELRGLSAASCFANLQILDLERCSGLTDQGFAALVADEDVVGSLTRINVSWTAISSSLLGKLMVKNAKTVQNVRLQGCQHVDCKIFHVFDGFSEEDLSPEPSAPTKALNRNQQWPRLERFDSKWVDAICDHDIFEAAKCVPRVTFIGYYGEKIIFQYNGH